MSPIREFAANAVADAVAAFSSQTGATRRLQALSAIAYYSQLSEVSLMLRYTSLLTTALALSLSAAVANAQVTQQPPARLPATKVVGETMKAVTVQNDRLTAVTLFIDADRVESAIGTVAAGSTAMLSLPGWALAGQRAVKLVARTDNNTKAIASYSLPVNEGLQLGLLVPPAEGISDADSMLVMLPKGAGTHATVTVSNERNRTVTVFAEQGLLFVRLGEIAAGQQGTLVVPSMLTKNKGELRVFARPEGAATVSTKALRLEQGDHIAVIVM